MVLMELSRGAFDDGGRSEVWAGAITLETDTRRAYVTRQRFVVPLGRVAATPPYGDGVQLVVGSTADIVRGQSGLYP